ncbi:hypothetical protein EFN49_06575 [Leuconostoc citreum]|uniref:pyocin knob domain-containing protein n=1 Tax=Leuconostoc citreum TaxID=33964 RepID=UPI0021A8B095|nr:pyocin knob domain-containing protein [Leuconostoc citreum]MCT3075353.1 hypothetical protein [Leuconostoc citreum]
MADSYSKWVMTNAFASNSQAALNTGNKIEWVALKTSDDTHTLNDLPGFNDTTLATAKIKQTSSINSVVLNGNTVTITGLFNSAGNTADYYIKTIFLVAKYNGAEFLAGATVANTSGSAFRMPAASTTEITEFTARPQISVTNSSTISTTVDPVAAATNERVNSLETSLNSKIEDINTDKQKLWNKFADYVTKATAETITGVKTFTQTIVGSITGNAGTATKLQTARLIGGVSFDGSTDINLPGVNTAGNQATTGKAASADILNTRLATFNDFVQVANDLFAYAGNWNINEGTKANGPKSDMSWSVVSVIVGNSRGTGLIITSTYRENVIYYTSVNGGTIQGWKKLSEDGKVVHNTGNETVAGDKTFTGKNTFTQAINGMFATKSIVATDYNDIAKSMYDNAGMGIIRGNALANSPIPDLTWYIIQVIPGNGQNDGYIQVYAKGIVYGTGVADGEIQGWVKLSDDSSVLHNTGNETSDGVKTFKKTIIGNITGNAGTANTLVVNDIADGTDLNSLRNAGNYSCGINKTSNAPVSGWFTLVVVQNGQSNGTQTLTDTNSGNVYTRVWNTSSNWFSTWEKLSSDSKVVHNSGNETIYDKKTFDAVTTFNNGIVNKPISMNGFKIDVSQLVSGTYNVWQNDISGCPGDFGVVEVFENVSNTLYRFTQTNLQDGPHVWVQIKNSFGFSGWKQQM